MDGFERSPTTEFVAPSEPSLPAIEGEAEQRPGRPEGDPLDSAPTPVEAPEDAPPTPPQTDGDEASAPPRILPGLEGVDSTEVLTGESDLHAGGGQARGGRARVIAIANQKGGVGKTTTAVNLGACLAEGGKQVLVVDLDPQGNASTGLGIGHDNRETTIYDVITAGTAISEAVVPTGVERLWAVPSTIDLAGAEIELVSQFSREGRLSRALDGVRDSFDFVLLDCPPSLGLLTVNALTAADELIVPIQCEYYALEGLGQLLRNVRLVQQNVNPNLRLTGIVLTMFDPRTKLADQVVAEVRSYFGSRVYDAVIPRSVRLAEAPGFGRPIVQYDPQSKGAAAYRRLAEELMSEEQEAGEGGVDARDGEMNTEPEARGSDGAAGSDAARPAAGRDSSRLEPSSAVGGETGARTDASSGDGPDEEGGTG